MLQLLWIPLLCVELVTQLFYLVTRSTLSPSLLGTYLEHVSLLSGAVASAPPTEHLVLSLLLLLGALVWPWLKITAAPVSPPAKRDKKAFLIKVMTTIALFTLALHPLRSSPAPRLAMQSMFALTAAPLLEATSSPPSLRASRELESTTQPPRSIILILLESTRADTLQAIPHRPETPRLRDTTYSTLAARGTQLTHAFAAVPHTSLAILAMHCGVTPPTNLSHHDYAKLDALDCLPRLLARKGYETGYFQGASLLFESNYALLKQAGYETTMGADDLEPTPFERMNYFGYEARAILEPVSAWLDNLPKDKPFLLTTMTLAPHHDYQLPKGYELRQLHEDETFNRYLNAVAYTDTWIAELLALLEERGLLQQSVVAIVGDHGEAFGEHGRNYHDNVIYQEALHIPMLLMGPDVPKGERLDTPASQLDLLPTLAHLAGFRLDGPADGVNVLAITEAEREAANSRQLVSYCWYERACAALIDWPYKFVHHFGNQPDELFHLIHDPLEQHDLATTQTTRAAAMADALHRRLGR